MRACWAVTVMASAAMAAQAAVVPFGPTPYREVADRPVAGPFSYSHLETFESGALSLVGVSADGGTVGNPSDLTDSVDEDDGALDGSGTRGHSYYSATRNFITFSFSAASLGSLPTVVGLVITDVGQTGDQLGIADAVFEAFDGSGALLGSIGVAGFGDAFITGTTDEDRFVGFRADAGIGSVRVGFANSTDWEMDHLFIARDALGIPEPASAGLALLGLAGLAGLRRRR